MVSWLPRRGICPKSSPFTICVLFGACFIILFLFLTVYPEAPKIEWAVPLTCMAAGGIGAFISSAVEEQ